MRPRLWLAACVRSSSANAGACQKRLAACVRITAAGAQLTLPVILERVRCGRSVQMTCICIKLFLLSSIRNVGTHQSFVRHIVSVTSFILMRQRVTYPQLTISLLHCKTKLRLFCPPTSSGVCSFSLFLFASFAFARNSFPRTLVIARQCGRRHILAYSVKKKTKKHVNITRSRPVRKSLPQL